MRIPTTASSRYLTLGLVVVAVDMMLPAGLTRDALFCLVGFSTVAAVVAGVRLNRPRAPLAWYLAAGSIASSILGQVVYVWYANVVGPVPFPSAADVFYLGSYPPLALALLVFVRSCSPRGASAALLDSALLTVGVGLLSWVWVIAPTWSTDASLVTRLVSVGYPIGEVMIFGMLVRLAVTPGGWNPSSRLLAGGIAGLLVVSRAMVVATLGPAIESHTTQFDPGWLVVYVIGGTLALHPVMRRLTARAAAGDVAVSAWRLAGPAAALMVGPVVVAYQLIAGVPVNTWAVVVVSVVLALLVLARMLQMLREVQDQAARLARLAETDYATGLENQRRFIERLTQTLGSHRPEAGLLLVDLERFTEINDTLGPRTGDAILYAVAERLGELTGPDARITRHGTHTFGILEPAIGSAGAAVDASARLQMALELPMAVAGLDVAVQVSVGTLLLPGDGPDAMLALHRAEVALSVAKSRPGRTAHYGAEMEAGETLAPLLIGSLSAALEHGEIVLYYQPQVEITSGHVVGVEALARWQHPELGLLGPDTFIAAAEQTGLIGPFTEYVLDAALAQCARWRRDGLELTVAVNLSVRNLLDPGLVDGVEAGLRRHGLHAGSLELEITESTAMVDPRRSMEALGALSAMGVTLSIDDYGTGHSSLAYLQRLPVGRLKIDRSFVTGMLDDEASAAIVHSTVELARHLRLDVVAEGVEDDLTLLRLREMSCYAAQGFGLGRPVPAAQVAGLVESIESRLAPILETHRASLTSSAPVGHR